MPLAYAEKLSGIFGIRDVVPRIWGYYFDEVEGANYTVLGVDNRRMPLGEKLDLTLAEGSMPEPGRVSQFAENGRGMGNQSWRRSWRFCR